MGRDSTCSRKSGEPHQSHATENGNPVDALHRQVDETGDDDDQVEDVPAACEVLLAQRHQLEHSLEGEEGGENLWGKTAMVPSRP